MSRHLVNELTNLPRTAPITCAGVQFGALHLAKICTCSSPNCTYHWAGN